MDANMHEFWMQYDSEYHRASLVVQCVRHERNEVADIQSMAEEALAQWRGDEGFKEMDKCVKRPQKEKNNPGVVILDPSDHTR